MAPTAAEIASAGDHLDEHGWCVCRGVVGAAVAADKGVWPPEYNEVVLDPAPFVHELPHAIEAFVFPAYPFFGYEGAHLCCNDRTREDAVDAHRKFLAKYEVTEMDVPLLEYSGRGPRPFREVWY
jgi:hypothetical protein